MMFSNHATLSLNIYLWLLQNLKAKGTEEVVIPPFYEMRTRKCNNMIKKQSTANQSSDFQMYCLSIFFVGNI